MMVETATPQRPALPATPFTAKTSLPPLSSILSNPGSMDSKHRASHPVLPSIDTFSTPMTSKYYTYPMSASMSVSGASAQPYLPYVTPSKSPYSAFAVSAPLPSIGATASTSVVSAPGVVTPAAAPVVTPASAAAASSTSSSPTAVVAAAPASVAPTSSLSPALLEAVSPQTSSPADSPTLKVQSTSSASKQNAASPSTSESSKKGRKRTSDKSYAFISHSPATFPSQEPSIDNVPLARRKRRRTSPNELSILNAEFELGSTPNKSRRLEIASRVSMSEKAVQIWFQNKRQSLRKASNHEKEVTELPPTPPISMLMQSTPIKAASGPVSPSASAPGSASGLPTLPVDNQLTRSQSIPHMNFAVPVYRHFNHSSPNISLSTVNSNTSIPINSSFDTSYDTTFHNKENLPKLNVKSILGDESSATEKKTTTQESPIKLAPVRKPLGDITSSSTNGGPKKETECIQNLLSLRAGTWK